MKVLLFLVSFIYCIYGYTYICVFYCADADEEMDIYGVSGSSGVIRNYTAKIEKRYTIDVDGEIYSFLCFNVALPISPNNMRDTILNRFRSEISSNVSDKLDMDYTMLSSNKGSKRVQLMVRGSGFCLDCASLTYDELYTLKKEVKTFDDNNTLEMLDFYQIYLEIKLRIKRDFKAENPDVVCDD